jgi:cation diffusion facilitator family transporter
MWAAVERLRAPQPLEQVGLGLVLSVVSSALNGGLAWLMFQSVREHRSMAVEADARHLVTDVWTSAGVVVGVGLAAMTGWLWMDPVVAIGVALNILREGVSLMWRSTEGLMDRALEPEVMAEVERTLALFRHRTIRFDHVASRRSGRRRFVDLHMHMPATVSLGRAAALRADVEQALMSAVPGLRATIQLLPSNVEPHSGDEEDLI